MTREELCSTLEAEGWELQPTGHPSYYTWGDWFCDVTEIHACVARKEDEPTVGYGYLSFRDARRQVLVVQAEPGISHDEMWKRTMGKQLWSH